MSVDSGSASAQHRRGFLGRLGASLLTLGALPGALAAERPVAESGVAVDEAWMDALTGKYRQVFDIKAVNEGGALAPARNFLNAYRDAYGVTDREVNVVIGLHGGAAVLAFNDAAWQRFHFGQSGDVIDGVTKMPSLRNPALTNAGLPSDALLPALQARGATVLLCNNSLMRLTRGLVAGGYGTEAAMRSELLGTYLLPGIVVVPAMVVAFNRLQMRGLTYVSG